MQVDGEGGGFVVFESVGERGPEGLGVVGRQSSPGCVQCSLGLVAFDVEPATGGGDLTIGGDLGLGAGGLAAGGVAAGDAGQCLLAVLGPDGSFVDIAGNRGRWADGGNVASVEGANVGECAALAGRLGGEGAFGASDLAGVPARARPSHGCAAPCVPPRHAHELDAKWRRLLDSIVARRSARGSGRR